MGARRSEHCRSLSAIAITVLTVTCIILTAVPAASAAASTVTVLRENFENPNFNCDTGWDQDGREMWVRGDNNPDSGADMWCHSQHRPFSSGGSWSAWCAVIGTNSIAAARGLGSQANTASYHYDANMTAYIRHSLSMSADRGAGTLTFSYWSKTLASSAPGGFDHLQVSVSSDNSSYTTIWTQPTANEGSWKQATASVPADARTISFDFISGPYAGSWEEGAYIDNILVTQVSDTSWSHVVPLPSYSPGTFDIEISVDSAQGTPESVKLYYRAGSSGGYSLFTDQTHADGAFSPGERIEFTSADEIDYQFYSIASGGGTTEPQPAVPDASTAVDLAAPQTTASVNRTANESGWYNTTVSVHLSAADQRCGVGSLRYRLDGGPWTPFSGDVIIADEGNHTLAYQATDAAGNAGTERSLAVRIDWTAPVTVYSVDDLGNVTLTPTDGLSGIGSGYVRTRGDEWTPYGSMDIMATSDVRAVDLYAVARAGNIEAARTLDLDALPLKSVALELGSIDASYAKGDTVRVSWTCGDPSGLVDHFEVLVDGAVVKVLPKTATSYDLLDLGDGERSITVRAVDSGGNCTYRSALLTVGGSSGDELSGLLLPAIVGVAAVGALVGAMFLRPRRSK
jgi:hypothetical protein